MPQLKVTTKAAEKVWASPDGQRVIHKVILDYNGQDAVAKTYSKDIATVGWSGTVETYEKPGRNGSETFVKQPPKEDGSYGSQGGTRGGSKPAYVPKDERAIQAMAAIKQAVALVGPVGPKADMSTILGVVHEVATELFDMVDLVKKGENTAVEHVFGEGTQVIGEEETPWNPETDQSIPIVEDVAEPPQLPV